MVQAARRGSLEKMLSRVLRRQKHGPKRESKRQLRMLSGISPDLATVAKQAVIANLPTSDQEHG